MKPKKSQKADLRGRRAIFFQVGFIVALTAAVFTFSAGRKEKTVERFPPVASPASEDIVEIPRTKEEPPKLKPMEIPYISDYIRIMPPDAVIETGYDFPQPEIDFIAIPKTVAEEPEDDIPLWFAEEMPSFQGGDLDSFRRWVFSRIEYPHAALVNGVQGRVQVRFVIEKDGSLTNIEVQFAPDRSLAEETERVLRTSPEWTPGRQRGKPVRVYFTLPVEYRINY